MVLREDNLIEKVTAERSPHYEPFGWHHWPEHPWLSYQFRRGLGETQEGGGTVSECFAAASRMIAGDTESWHREWLTVAERNFARGEELEIPYEGASLYAFFASAATSTDRQPCLISMGGLDSIKDEMWFMQAHGAVQRGISVLMIDGPGQGGTLRRHKIANRPDYEVPVAYCIDYLHTRGDVDHS